MRSIKIAFLKEPNSVESNNAAHCIQLLQVLTFTEYIMYNLFKA